MNAARMIVGGLLLLCIGGCGGAGNGSDAVDASGPGTGTDDPNPGDLAPGVWTVDAWDGFLWADDEIGAYNG